MVEQASEQFGNAIYTILVAVRSTVIALALALFVPFSVDAQVPTPTPEQLQLLNSLPPAQREQILNQLRQFQSQGQGQLQGQSQPEFPDVVIPTARLEMSDAEAGLALGLPPRLEVGSTLVIEFALLEEVEAMLAAQREAELQGQQDTQRESLLVRPILRGEALTEEQRIELEAFRDRLAAGNPYELDIAGSLYLPGVPTIALAGLTVDEAAIRIGAEPSLRNMQVSVTLLPLEPVGVEALEPFGYELFRGVPTTFAPATDVPVPAEYVMGPGDTVNVQLFGNENAGFALVVSRDGAINLPQIGPINVGGLTFVEMRDIIAQRIAEQMIGVRSSITLGELRSIRIFVLGDVERPGSYTVSGLSTMVNALFVSGGVQEIGTLRNIELKRDGETVSTLDLYDLLLRGDTSNDERLLPGDVIFVPPIGDTVSVGGNVRRPAIYELNGETSVEELINLSGGLRPDADGSTLKLERIVPGRGVSVRDIDLGTEIGSAEPVRDGDVIRVPINPGLLEEAVRLAGNVHQPGLYEWFDGMSLVDLIASPARIKPKSDLHYVLIRREIEPNVYVEALSADLQSAWRDSEGLDNVELRPRDTVYVFNLEVGRRNVVAPLIEELRTQAPANQSVPMASIGGQVRAPGEYPLEPGMRISDLIRAGGGLAESAYATDAELTRYEIVNGEYRETGVLTVDLAAIISGSEAADLLVSAHDYLNIKEVPLWSERQTVELVGEVRFPGTYPIRQGELLSSVLARAGNPTEFAFLEGSAFTRAELRRRESEQLETLARRLENDLVSLSLADPGGAETLTTGQALVAQLREAVPTGRLVIRLDEIVAGVAEADVVLKDGDRLILPSLSQEVTVLGEVQYSTSHLFVPGLSRTDYVDRSGGLTSRADDRRTYVVRANGEVVANARSRWFDRRANATILAGDTIVVPLDVDRGRGLERWTSITQIIYNTAIAAAAVQSF